MVSSPRLLVTTPAAQPRSSGRGRCRFDADFCHDAAHADRGRIAMRIVSSLILFSALAVGCADSAERPARWSYIHAAIIQPSCTTASCHSALTAIGGVNLSERQGAYTVLTGKICGAPTSPLDPPRNYVTPFSAETSRLYHQLVGENTDVMPPDTSLPETEIELVARWIDEGARCD